MRWLLVLVAAAFAALATATSSSVVTPHSLRTRLLSDPEDAMRDPETFLDLVRFADEIKHEFASDLSKMSCDSCVSVVTTIAEVSLDARKMVQLQTLAAIGCATAFKDSEKAATCKKIAKMALTLLPKATAALMKLEWQAEAVCSFIVPVCSIECCETKDKPEQIHLALGSDPTTEMVVSWVALTETEEAYVLLREAAGGEEIKVTAPPATTYHVSQWQGYIYHTPLSGLRPDTVYEYAVSSNGVLSAPFTFHTLPDEDALGTKARPLRIVQFADVDYGIGKMMLDALAAQLDELKPDVVLLVGDTGYADGWEAHWDLFMRVLQPVASRVPVMAVPGNHELLNNFKAFTTRFAMPLAAGSAFDFAMRLGNTHISMLSSESQLNTPQITDAQIKWFQSELSQERAANATWRIAAFHRPMYCTTHSGKPQCAEFAKYLRSRLEMSFLDFGIDLHISGHQHGFERTYPTAYSRRVNETYDMPGAPVYVVSGAGGNREGTRAVSVDQPWSAVGSEERGFLFISVTEHEMDVVYYGTPSLQVVDHFTIRK